VSISDESSKHLFGLHVQNVLGNTCPKTFPVGAGADEDSSNEKKACQ